MTPGQLSRIFATRVKIMPHYSVAYTYELTPRLSACNRPEQNTANGLLSQKARQRIQHACHWLKYLSNMEKRKLVFITLTLSQEQRHPDNFIRKHMLEPMLKWIQRQYGANLYVWKAEVQPQRYYKRNERCIHFHITTNRYIPYARLRHKWNSLQQAHGYIDGNIDTPSTEIRAVKNEKDFVNYMAKYLSKKEENPALTVNCKVWGCSRQLSRMNVTIGDDVTPDFHNIMDDFIKLTSEGEKQLKHAKLWFTSLRNKKKIPPALMEIIAKARDDAKGEK